MCVFASSVDRLFLDGRTHILRYPLYYGLADVLGGLESISQQETMFTNGFPWVIRELSGNELLYTALNINKSVIDNDLDVNSDFRQTVRHLYEACGSMLREMCPSIPRTVSRGLIDSLDKGSNILRLVYFSESMRDRPLVDGLHLDPSFITIQMRTPGFFVREMTRGKGVELIPTSQNTALVFFGEEYPDRALMHKVKISPDVQGQYFSAAYYVTTN